MDFKKLAEDVQKARRADHARKVRAMRTWYRAAAQFHERHWMAAAGTACEAAGATLEAIWEYDHDEVTPKSE